MDRYSLQRPTQIMFAEAAARHLDSTKSYVQQDVDSLVVYVAEVRVFHLHHAYSMYTLTPCARSNSDSRNSETISLTLGRRTRLPAYTWINFKPVNNVVRNWTVRQRCLCLSYILCAICCRMPVVVLSPPMWAVLTSKADVLRVRIACMFVDEI